VLISLVSVLNLLYFYISTFRSMCAVPNMDVFCNSLTSCFPGMLLTYFLNDFEIVPVAPIITGITFVFTFHMSCISILRSLYLLLLLLLLLCNGGAVHEDDTQNKDHYCHCEEQRQLWWKEENCQAWLGIDKTVHEGAVGTCNV